MKMSNQFYEGLTIESDPNNVVSSSISSIKVAISEEVKKTSAENVISNLVYSQTDIVYKFSKDRKNPPGRSLHFEKKTIDDFESKGYISVDKGLSNKAVKELEAAGQDVSKYKINGVSGRNKGTMISLTDKGKEYFKEIIVFTDLVTKREKIEKGKYREILFQLDETPMIEYLKKLMQDFNSIIRKHTLTYVDAQTKETHIFTNNSRIIYTGNESNTIHNDGARGGRIYSNVSYMWKKNRRSVLIDGKATVELDFKCSLPSILAAKLHNFDLSLLKKSGRDLYYVPDENINVEKNQQDKEDLRDLAKKIVVCIISVKSEESLERTLRYKFDGYHKGYYENGSLMERFFPESFNLDDVMRVKDKVLDRLRKMLPNLDRDIFREDLVSNKLQGIEARIAMRIVRDFVAENKAILCIYDSFRVLESDEDFLRESMEKAYIAEVGKAPLGITADRQEQVVHESLSMDIPSFTIDYNAVYDSVLSEELQQELFDIRVQALDDLEEYGEYEAPVIDIANVAEIIFCHNGLKYKHENNADFVFNQSGLGETWIKQKDNSAYELYKEYVQC